MKNIIKYILSLGRKRLVVTGVVANQPAPKPAELNLLPEPKKHHKHHKHTRR